MKPREVRISQTIAEEKNFGAHVREESDSASVGTQSAKRLGLAYQSQKGRLQPRVQQNDPRLFSFGYGSRRSVDFTTRPVDDLVDSMMRTSAPSLRDAI
jgi:hypothetical protein